MAANVIVPTVPKDQQELKQFLQNGSDAMTRIEAERDHIKSIVDEASEKFDLPKKYIRKLIKIHHEQNLELIQQEQEDISTLYETITGKGE